MKLRVPLSAKATTTVEQDLHTKAQRANDMVWERTQRQIALLVVTSAIIYAFITVFYTPKVEATSIFFASSFSLIVGFYFGRTNHQRGGGVVNEK